MNFKDYLNWASSSLNASYHNSITIRDYDIDNNTERGIISSKIIKANTPLFSIPLQSLLTIDSINNDNIELLKPLLSLESINEDDILSLLLIFERYKGVKSKWAMHISILPTNYDSLPNYNDSDLEVIKGCNLYNIGIKWKLQIKEDYEKLMNIKLKYENDDIYVKDIFIKYFNNNNCIINFDDYIWALSTIWSRFISVNIDKKSLRAMVPLIDLLNHNSNSTTSHIIVDNNMIIISNTDTSMGEIYLNYGLVSNSRLLQLYGFTLKDNEYNSVDIYLDTNVNKLVLKVLQILDIEYGDGKPFKLSLNDNTVKKILVLLRLQYADTKILKNEMKLLKFIKSPSSFVIEDKIIKKLKDILLQLLSKYLTTIEEDEVILKGTNLSSRYLNGVNLRYSEKKVLMKALRDLEAVEAQTLLLVRKRKLDNYSDHLIVGCSSFGGLYTEIGEEKSIETIASAIDLNFRLFDTAPHYGLGLSEQRLGRGLSKFNRDNLNIKIYTKVGRLIFDKKDIDISNTSDLRIELENTRSNPSCIFPETDENKIPVKNYTYDSIMRSYHDSIKRLGLSAQLPNSDDIQLYGLRIHDSEDEVSIRELFDGGGLNALNDLKNDNKIQDVSLGLNNSTIALLILKEAKRRNLQIDSLMIAGEFNLLDHSIETIQLFYYCQCENIEIHNAGIFASGVLTGNGKYYKYKLASTELLDTVEQWKALCSEYQFDIKQVSLAFSMLPQVVTKVAVGIKSTVELEELIVNYETIGLIYSSDIFIKAKKKNLLANYLHFDL